MRGLWPVFVVLLLFLQGCKPAQPIVPENLLPEPIANEAPLPSYSDLVGRYNATTAPLSRIWAEARVDLEWINEKGDRKSEHGDGRFMFVSPDKVALEIQEFGKGFWAGGDGERYWLFDLQDKRTVYVGRFDRLAQLDEDAFPLPVKPSDLLYVLGLIPIDADNVPDAPAVERVAGHYLIEPPGLGIRMLLHPDTARPVRVDILNKAGESVVKCILSEPVDVKTKADADGGLKPVISTRVDVYVLGEEAHMTLRLKSATTDGTQIRDAHYDYDKLLRVYKPDEVVDLDAQP
ncbi:MAG: hypothetical protein R3C45_05260 [Phycisphaerales bacterium]